jgi:hypothetical protein
MLPVISEFMVAHDLPDVTVVADAGMVSEANQKAIEAAGLSFILGTKIPHEPYVVQRWRHEHPGEPIPDGHVFTQPWPAGPNGGRCDQVIYYQYRHDRAHRTLRGIDEQVAKAEKAAAGQIPVKRNRFIRLPSGTPTVNRELETKARALAGLKGYVTNLRACPDGTPVAAEFVIGAHHPLLQIEKSFPDGQKRPAGPPGVPPHPRLDRSPPDHRVRRAGRQPLDRASHRLVHPQVRQDHPQIPHHPDPGRRPPHHCSRPATRRPAPRHRRDQRQQLTCALVWPKSGHVTLDI